jgi:AcrR family transcriptional regulator
VVVDRPTARRADATRNRERILRSAREAFAEADLEVSMAEVARRSGVGSATLYRNFPSRRDLLEALYIDEVEDICAAAATVDGVDAGARFTAWLHRFFEFATGKRSIAIELLEQSDRSNPVFWTSRDRVVAAGRPLHSAARECGEITEDITLEQILDLLVAVAKIPGGPDHLRPILHTVLAGLRRRGPTSESVTSRWT